MAQATLQLCPRAGPHRKVFLEQEEEPGRMAGVMQRLHGYKATSERFPRDFDYRCTLCPSRPAHTEAAQREMQGAGGGGPAIHW